MNNREIKIYAPCDGTIDSIEAINDDLFSQKILGDGFFIIPKIKNKISLRSCLDNSKVALTTDTKHATYLQIKEGPTCLIHVGLDSKYYDKNTFNQSIKTDDKVSKETIIVEFDAKYFVDKNLRLDIPVVFEPESAKNFKFKLIKKGAVKAGEQIGLLNEIVVEENKQKKVNIGKNNKFELAAEKLIDLVGKNNFDSVANCMTRTRFYVIDKSQVNIKEIEKIDIVKGTIWSGNELQVVIGGDSYKVKEAVLKIMSGGNSKKTGEFKIENSQKKIKKSLWQKFLAACNGIIVPLMPLLISTGLLSGLSAILVTTGVISGDIPEGGFVTDMDLISGIMYIISNTGLALLAIFFCYSTVKYLGGDPTMGILIGLTIASRYFMTMAGGSGEWHLFNIGDLEISIKAYNNNILPAVGAGILYFWIDKFIKTWMPGVVDIIFRPFIAYVVTVFGVFFVFGPILGILESSIASASVWFYEIPFGIGGLLLGLIYEPIVFLGMGWPVWLAVDAEYFANSSEAVLRGLPIMDAAALAMIGTLLAMSFKAKNKKEKGSIYGAMTPLVFGITEPALYGVTSQKGKPFWISCVGAGVSGLLLSLFSVTRENIGGYGVLGALGHTDPRDIYLYFAFAGVGLGVNFVLTWFLYTDKKSERQLIKAANKKLFLFVKYNSNEKDNFDKDQFSNEFTTITEKITGQKELRSEILKKYYELEKMKSKIETLQNRNEQLNNSKRNQNDKIDTNDNKILNINNEIEEMQNILSSQLITFNKLNTEIINEIKLIISNIKVKALESKKDEFINLYWNAVNDLAIYIEKDDAKNIDLTKQEILNTNNKFKLLLNF